MTGDLERMVTLPGSAFRGMAPIFPARVEADRSEKAPAVEQGAESPLRLAPDRLTLSPPPAPPRRATAASVPVVPTSSTIVPILELSGFHGYLEPYVSKEDSATEKVGGAAELSGAIHEQERGHPDALVISGGDFFQGPPISSAFDGRPVIEVMNHDRYDAMTLGNHDFDRGVDFLVKRLRDAKFVPLAANLCDGRSGRPIWETDHPLHMVRPYFVKSVAGRKVAVVGLMKADTPLLTGPWNVRGLAWRSVSDTLRSILPQLVRDEKPDAIVLHCQDIQDSRAVLHVAHEALEQAAGAHPVPSLVFMGGHNCSEFDQPVMTPDGLVVQSTDRGAALNVTRLELAPDAPRVRGFQHEYVPLVASRVKPDPAVAAIVARYHDALDQSYRATVGVINNDLSRSRHQDSSVGVLVTEAMRRATGADLAFVTGGALKDDLRQGPITADDVYRMLPFDNHLVVVRMSGRDVLKVLEHSAERPTGDKVLQMAGARMVYDASRPAGERLLSATIDGHPIDPDHKFTVAIDDFLAGGGDYFHEFCNAEKLSEGISVKDTILQYLHDHSPMTVHRDGRILELNGSGD